MFSGNLIMSNVPFIVKVEGQSYSNHRNPQGVYGVEVVEEKSIVHSACAAVQVAKDNVPFLNENPNGFTIRVFDQSGNEVLIPSLLTTVNEDKGFFCGRLKDYPETITLQ